MKLIKILQFLRLVDEDQRLSLTNIAVYIALVRLVTTEATPLDVGALISSLANYAHTKRVRALLSQQTQDSDTEGVVNGNDN